MQVSVTRIVRKGLVSAVITAVAGLLAVGVGTTAQAAPRTSGAVRPPLHTVGKTVRLAPAKGLFSDVFTEAPNGAVYFAVGKTVSVVNGTAAPKVVLRTSQRVLALAANTREFFVQTGLTVSEYYRSNGKLIRRKTLTSPVTPITSAGLYAVGSTIWSWTDWATDSSGFELATVSKWNLVTGVATVISRGNAYAGDMAADSTGAYYEVVKANQANGLIIRALPGGGTRRVTDVNLDAPLALSGGRVDLLSLHANNHTYIDSYLEKSLTAARSKRVPADASAIGGTSAGLLVVQIPCAGSCPKTTVGVLNPLTGSVSKSVKVRGAAPLVLGPVPAVIAQSGSWLYLVRLAG